MLTSLNLGPSHPLPAEYWPGCLSALLKDQETDTPWAAFNGWAIQSERKEISPIFSFRLWSNAEDSAPLFSTWLLLLHCRCSRGGNHAPLLIWQEAGRRWIIIFRLGNCSAQFFSLEEFKVWIQGKNRNVNFLKKNCSVSQVLVTGETRVGGVLVIYLMIRISSEPFACINYELNF